MNLRALCLLLGLVLPAASMAQDVVVGTGAVLRGLDKLNGTSVDMVLANGEKTELGRLTVILSECRYPADDLAGDAFAFLTIQDSNGTDPIFEGWMIASSPALSAMEHPRYDVWVLRCTTE